MKKWKCSVCGYIHIGEEPPEKCPVCGADRSLFTLLEEEIPSDAPAADVTPDPATTTESAPSAEPIDDESAPSPAKPKTPYDYITQAMTQLHAHPISVHIPNGLLPVSILFFFISAIFHHHGFGSAAVYNLFVVVLVMPFVLYSGINDWKNRFGGHFTTVFVTKMICGGIVSLLAPILLIWRLIQPELLLTPSVSRAKFIFLSLVLLAAAGVAGYMGGKLVFLPQSKR